LRSSKLAWPKKEITIHRKLAEDLFAIEADKGQIEQICFNLFVNADGAMRGGVAYHRMKEINADVKVLLLRGCSMNSEATESLRGVVMVL
jgi:nitrogen fixation/metabolism regulation signal transduction histidine kinase